MNGKGTTVTADYTNPLNLVALAIIDGNLQLDVSPEGKLSFKTVKTPVYTDEQAEQVAIAVVSSVLKEREKQSDTSITPEHKNRIINVYDDEINLIKTGLLNRDATLGLTEQFKDTVSHLVRLNGIPVFEKQADLDVAHNKAIELLTTHSEEEIAPNHVYEYIQDYKLALIRSERHLAGYAEDNPLRIPYPHQITESNDVRDQQYYRAVLETLGEFLRAQDILRNRFVASE